MGAQLSDALASVHLNEAQSSTFQPDVQFRGFASSPLLGLPQGLAVYQDGVRVNEPFGDTVNWDALPANAVAGVVLMPGSNPLFGLNALGGALSLQTKTGFSHPGHAARVLRRLVRAAVGGAGERRASRRQRGLLRGGPLAPGGRLAGPLAVARHAGVREPVVAIRSLTRRGTVTVSTNRLIGNGPAPVQLLLEDRRQMFTHPDETTTDIGLFSMNARRQVRPGFDLEAVAYFRPATVGTFNGDDTPYDECEARRFRELLCQDDGEGPPVLDRDGHPLPTTTAIPLDATNNSSTPARAAGGRRRRPRSRGHLAAATTILSAAPASTARIALCLGDRAGVPD